MQGQPGVDFSKAPCIDVAVSEQTEQQPQLDGTARVGELSVLIERKLASGDGVLGIGPGAQRAQRLKRFAIYRRALVKPLDAVGSGGGEHQIEGAEGFRHTPRRRLPPRQRFENAGKVRLRCGEHLRGQERIGRLRLLGSRPRHAQQSEQQAEPQHHGPATIGSPCAGKFGGKLFN